MAKTMGGAPAGAPLPFPDLLLASGQLTIEHSMSSVQTQIPLLLQREVKTRTIWELRLEGEGKLARVWLPSQNPPAEQ